MGRVDRFAKVSVALAAVSTILYWAAYADKQRVTAERRAVLAATARPIVLNGFRPILRGVSHDVKSAGPSERAEEGIPRLLFVVSDTCPGSGLAVPQWLDWIARAPNQGYAAVVVSTEGRNHSSQITDAFASRGVSTVSLQVTQLEEFTLSSGVSATPAMFAIDRHGFVRLVTGMFSQATQRELEKFLEAEKVLATH